MRCEAMEIMRNSPTQYIKYYVQLENQYQGSKDVYEKFEEKLKSNIRKKAEDGCYKFQMYLKLNPQLEPSPEKISNNIYFFGHGTFFDDVIEQDRQTEIQNGRQLH